MLYPTAGTRLFIADAPADWPGALPASGWIEIGETEALGLMGVEWDLVDVTHMGSQSGEETIKTLIRRPPMEIILGNDPTDPGQAILWRAARSRDLWPFRLVFPDGTTRREWWAAVMALAEVFDAANAIIKIQASIKPASEIIRSEDSE